MSDANRKPFMDVAESETLRMRGNSMHGNRETLETLASQDAGRSEKATCRTADMHVSRESDGLIVPEKQTNNDGPSSAESVEGRGLTEENADQLLPDRTQRRVPGSRGLLGVREVAHRDLVPTCGMLVMIRGKSRMR